jgi:hypothetical protein
VLDIACLQRIRLSRRPLSQRLVAKILDFNYGVYPGVTIDMVNAEQVPDEQVIFAMNHTDRFNYFPFQLRWKDLRNRFTATWVKGKYYEHPLSAKFMEWTSNLPTVSRGYIISRDFMAITGRRPSKEEYRVVRNWVNETARGKRAEPSAPIPTALLETPRSILGRPFAPSDELYCDAINGTYEEMMREFTRLNERVFETGLDLLVFPEGTRSIRLSRGRPGIAHIACHTKRTIVPVGCSGSDKVYPGSSPMARKGHISYRFGAPIPYEEYSSWAPDVAFAPFSAKAEHDHGEAFQSISDLIMERINTLVDPDYRFDDSLSSQGVQGVSRFL